MHVLRAAMGPRSFAAKQQSFKNTKGAAAQRDEQSPRVVVLHQVSDEFGLKITTTRFAPASLAFDYEGPKRQAPSPALKVPAREGVKSLVFPAVAALVCTGPSLTAASANAETLHWPPSLQRTKPLTSLATQLHRIFQAGHQPPAQYDFAWP